MCSAEEIERVFMQLGEDVLEGLQACKGDNFKYGMWTGKLIALEWVLGGRSSDLAIHYDFEDWELEARSHKGTIPPP